MQPAAGAPRRSSLSPGFSHASVADDSGVAVSGGVTHDLLLVSVGLLVVWQLERLQELPRVRTWSGSGSGLGLGVGLGLAVTLTLTL